MDIKSYLKYIKIGDIVILVFMVIAVVVSSGWFWFGDNFQNDRIVVVEVEGEVVKELDFPQGGETKTVEIDIPKGETTLKLENDKVRVEPMPSEICPRGICYSTGWIRHPQETIVCVPNQMVITIEGDEEEEKPYDGETW